MNKKLKLLCKQGIKKKIDTKWFKIINVILLICIPLLINIDHVIKYFGGNFDEKQTIYVVDSTNQYYDSFKSIMDKDSSYLTNEVKVERVNDYSKIKDSIIEKKNKDIILNISNNKISMYSYEYVDQVLLSVISSSLNSVKSSITLMNANIDPEILTSLYTPVDIERIYLSEEVLDENYELINYLSTMVIPAFILPFFMILILVVQMIGAEINEEKVSKSMEIIITSVPPKIHFISKMISANVYALIQSLLLVIYAGVGLFIRSLLSSDGILGSFGPELSKMLETFLKSGMFQNIIVALPWVIVMLLLSFLAYSLLAGILASSSTSQEDFQQLQTPLMLLVVIGYYISIMASQFDKSTFIIVLSMVPFLSSIIAPVLLMLGEIGLWEIIISILLLLGVILILFKYGFRIYKSGILNYSSSNLWKKMIKSAKANE